MLATLMLLFVLAIIGLFLLLVFLQQDNHPAEQQKPILTEAELKEIQKKRHR